MFRMLSRLLTFFWLFPAGPIPYGILPDGLMPAELTSAGLLAAEVDFASQVQPILARNCFACHGPDDQQSGIRLDQRDSLLVAADSGAKAIVPFEPEASEIIQRITSDDHSLRMPPEGAPLKESEISILKQWIIEGAEYSPHWAFQPVKPSIPPETLGSQTVTIGVDSFIQHLLDNKGIAQTAAASPEELIRRVYFDVIGLPPTPEEIEGLLKDWSPLAYERLVDSLLSDPRFGERWSRMWLDVVRYAESNSFERDNPKPNAWRYRDYVIRSFNDDKPYDQFVREQIAGDQLDLVSMDTLSGTAFYRLGLWDDEPADPLQAQFDEYDDIISTMGQAFLGLTIGCARCHDHKIDPVSQRDYYSLLAFIRDVTPYATRIDQTTNNQVDLDPTLSQKFRVLDSQTRKLTRSLTKIEQAGILRMTAIDQRATEGDDRQRVLAEKLQEHLDDEAWQEYSELKLRLAEVEARKAELPERETTLGLGKLDPNPPATFVLRRGSPYSQAEQVGAGIPSLFVSDSDGEDTSPVENLAMGRRQLAEWIASADNWMTARVIVNRVWQHYFGRGIVRSPNNFGLMGDPPTHPELLDYLAGQLTNNGWSMKLIHRQILLSAAYQRSSVNIAESLQRDPANDFFWKQNLRRLSAEQIRDAILAVTGQLNFTQSGPPIYPQLSAEVLASQSQPGQNWGRSSAEDRARRSIYIHVKRSLPVPILSVFDFPDTDTSCEARFLTVQPGQALTMLNSQWMQEQAQVLLERVQRETGDDVSRQAARCLELVTGRPAEHDNVQLLVELVDRLKHVDGMDETDARKSMCLVALNLNQFIYLE